VVGQWAWLARRGSLGLGKVQQKKGRKSFPFSACTSRGRRKRNSVVQNNTVLILRINAIASLPISVSTPIVGRVFHFSPWSLIYAI
jgi:hypothetical protein